MEGNLSRVEDQPVNDFLAFASFTALTYPRVNLEAKASLQCALFMMP